MTNGTDRALDNMEDGIWAKSVRTMDQYIQQFKSAVTDCHMVGLDLDDKLQRRIFLKHAPNKLREYLLNFAWREDVSMSELFKFALSWSSRGGVDVFKTSTTGARRVEAYPQEVSNRTGVGEFPSRGLPGTHDVSRTYGGPEGAARGRMTPEMVSRRTRGACYVCGKPGHMARECKERVQSAVKVALVESEDQGPLHEEAHNARESEDLVWPSSSVLVSRAGEKQYANVPMVEARIQGKNGCKGCILSALVDTGASVTLCSKKLVDELYRNGVLGRGDIKCEKGMTVTYADGTEGSAIGTVALTLDGVSVVAHVLPVVSPDFIMGIDTIRQHGGAKARLVKCLGFDELMSAKLLEEEVGLDGGSKSEEDDFPGTRAARVQGESLTEFSNHADWPDIHLNWVSERRPSERNLNMALKEAYATERRLIAKGLVDAYQAVIDEWIENGWLKATSKDEVKNVFRHFAVRKDSGGATAMSRCRLVVDGSSLGEFVNAGECTHKDLVRNLILWRMSSRFSSLDISSAYMRLRIAEEDQYYMAIVWKGQAYRFTSLPMGVSCSASCLQTCVDALLAQWKSQYRSSSGVNIIVVPYMDDLLQLALPVEETTSVSSEEELEARQSLVTFLNGKGMKISTPKLFGTQESGLGQKGKVLGVSIKGERIELGASIDISRVGETMSRKLAVGILSALYDPLGLRAELVLKARDIIRSTAGVAWSQPVERATMEKVIELARNVNIVSGSVPRRICRGSGNVVYVFTDASKIGIGIVVLMQASDGLWIRGYAKSVLYKNYQRKWTSISAKIELLALHHTLQVIQYLVKVFEEAGWTIQWRVGTDSEVNVNRMASEEAIAKVTDPWQKKVAGLCANSFHNLGAMVFHVRGDDNPADAVSRGNWYSEEEKQRCYQRAVQSFSLERAFVPPKVSIGKGEEVCLGESGVVGVCGNAATTGPQELRVCLAERFLLERPAESSREQWIREYQDRDAKISVMKRKGLLAEHNGVLVRNGRQTLQGDPLRQIVVPRELMANVLRACHEGTGHLGAGKTLIKVLDEYYWKGASKDVRKYVGQCEVCQAVKGQREWNTEPGLLYTDGRLWSTVSCDLVKGFGKHVILVMVCLYSRYMHVVAIKGESTRAIIKALGSVFDAEGPCSTLVTDNAAVFISEEFRHYLTFWGVRWRNIPRYSGFYAGWYERQHATLISVLSCVTEGRSDWARVLQLAALYANARPYDQNVGEVGGALSPFEVFKGRKLGSFFDLAMESDDPVPEESQVFENIGSLIEERRAVARKYEEVWKALRTKSVRNMGRKVRNVDVLKVGDSVYAWIPKLRKQKHGPLWEGPYQVQEILTPTATIVRVNGKVEHAFNLKRAHLSASCTALNHAGYVAFTKPGGELLPY
jgi:hypothetical protein